ncbi:hypothetical protein M378DRAFT_7294 [Amanita muscaria Koide BX008]|uniref:Uncharacterized protein n=1 Tax=Amanita muscaria (strain Koide BX008) TaxID=946122 RepID=A0A0C2XMU0_AMAMK|nr:hypothetical protein M378DRAFT_7294 [Amanita muscaria Koide BX008]
MSTGRKIHKGLNGISSDYFPIWDETLGYERGLPHFRQPPAFSELGVLIPTAGGYAYQPLHSRVELPMPASSQLSPTGQVEVEDNSSALMTLPLEHEIGDPSYLALWEPTAWASAQSNSSGEVWYPPSAEGSLYPFNPLYPHNTLFEDPYISSDLAEQSAMEGIEDQTYFQTTFPPSMDTASGFTSAPRNMPWDTPGPYDQA